MTDSRVQTLGRKPRLNGIRGVAITLVILYHVARSVPGGFIGVDIFFVLSGFLITTLLINEQASVGRISLRQFYIRRALRLGPALALFLGVCLAVAFTYQGSSRWDAFRFVGVSAFYVANIAAAEGVHITYEHTWSLAAEEQFYLVWPIAVVLLIRRRSSHALLIGLAAGGAIASAVLRVVLWNWGGHARDWSFLYFNPLTHADGILVGCLLGLLFSWRLLPSFRIIRPVGYAALAGLVALALLLTTRSAFLYDGGLLLVALLGAAFVAAALDDSARPLAFLAWRPVAYLGVISYGVYLWNSFVFAPWRFYGTTLKAVEGIIVTIAIAALSFHFVERRFLRLKARHVPAPELADVIVEPAEPMHPPTPAEA